MDSMTQKRIESATAKPTVPTILVSWLAVFRPCFTAPVWNHILVLVGGTVLAPGKRTVTQVLRVMGLADRPGFGRYHEVLNRARWDAREVARRLLLHLLAVLLPNGEVVIGIDDTIERRWGGKIKARGIYRDAVRSSHGHFVKTSGLRWLALAVMVPVPFAGRRWALPFLTVLAPSARWSEAQGKRHKALTDWARQAILQTKRWLPDRRVIVAADSGQTRKLEYVSDTAVWYHNGMPPAAIRWVLVRDPSGQREAQAFLCTDLHLEPAAILKRFVSRWRIETTFQEAREHLGVETQRQWSDLAILRTTPALFGLYSLVTVWAHGLTQKSSTAVRPHPAAWYNKHQPTFSDAIAAVRRVLWSPPSFSMCRSGSESIEIPVALLNRFVETLCLAA